MKKVFFIFIFLFCLLFGASDFAFAEKLEAHFFYSNTCPHCAAEEKFLDRIENDYPEIKINRYLASDKENQELLKNLCQECGAEKYIGVVPLTFIEGEFFVGFDSEDGIGREIENTIREKLGYDPISESDKKFITVPIFGAIDAEEYSLPALTVVLGFLDGFNVCSLGALVFILGLVLSLKSRIKTLVFGGIFILTTAIIYGILMLLWYKLFGVLSSFMGAMQILVGFIAIAGGSYFFFQFLKIKKQGPICDIKPGQKITSKLGSRIQESLKGSNAFAILGSIFSFAALITVVEFPCSAAVPVVYTGILAQANLNSIQYVLYIAFFVILYMLDELIVFLVAFFTMNLWLTSGKFTAVITLIEAIVLFALGFYYISGFISQ